MIAVNKIIVKITDKMITHTNTVVLSNKSQVMSNLLYQFRTGCIVSAFTAKTKLVRQAIQDNQSNLINQT